MRSQGLAPEGLLEHAPTAGIVLLHGQDSTWWISEMVELRNSRETGRGSAEIAGRLALSNLSASSPNPFLFIPSRSSLESLALETGAVAIRKLRFEGQICSAGEAAWRLEGYLGATVVQECIVTLRHVKSRIDVPVERLYTTSPLPLGAAYSKVPDLDIEHTEEFVDLFSIAREVLVLEMPGYPRADGVELSAREEEDGEAPVPGSETFRPFESLSALRTRLNS